MSEEYTRQIRDKARELLEKGTVDCVIGYETGSDGINARPVFIYSPAEAERLVFDKTCSHNLVKYLLNRKGKATAVVVKGCDSRALNLLFSERQIKREEVFAIGVVCPGVVEWGWNSQSSELQKRCGWCRTHTPVISDFMVGERVTEEPPPGFDDVDEMAAKTAEERAVFWQEQAAKCIRCYACRQACPGCYCIDCFVEQLDPEWVGIKIDTPENLMWNTIRAYHLGGRCISCNECERVCPVNLPLSLLNRRLEQEVLNKFDYRAGMSEDAVAPLITFKKDEKLGIGE